jgi:hypothetical protein
VWGKQQDALHQGEGFNKAMVQAHVSACHAEPILVERQSLLGAGKSLQR